MKILVCLIAVLAITAPVLATTVTIVGETDGLNLTLSYYVTPDTDSLRGIALTLDTDGAATTNDAGTTKGANWNVCLDHAYDVVTAAGTYNLSDGGPLAIIDGPGVPVGDVGDVSGFSICVGYVDEGGGQGGVLPGSQGAPEELCTIAFSGGCTVTVAADMLRGGAVGSPVDIVLDMDNDGSLKDTIDVDDECFQVGQFVGGLLVTQTMYNNWITAGQPLSWCEPGHAAGDANGDCLVNAGDVLSGPTPNFQDAFPSAFGGPTYEPSCDTNNDLLINAADIMGDVSVTVDPVVTSGSTGLGPNFPWSVPNCP